MLRLIFWTLLFSTVTHALSAQDFISQLQGQWEDRASTNSSSFQLVVRENQLAFLNIPQANLTDPVDLSYELLHDYELVDEQFIVYAKQPHLDPVQAKYNPQQYAIMRIDELSDFYLKVSLADHKWERAALDSIIDNKLLNQQIGERTIAYQKLDLVSAKNQALLLGLWEDELSDDSTSYQFFVQKSNFGFLKIKKSVKAAPTAIRPGKAYNYQWIDANTFYYHKVTTGISKTLPDPTPYVLMRIESVDRKRLVVTLSNRPFNKKSLDFILKEGSLDTYFSANKRTYRRINIVEEKCEGTEMVRIGNEDVIVNKKPIIYLYPTKEQPVNVQVNLAGQLTHTYPQYDPSKGWEVVAKPDGTLIHPTTGRNYYALYWEGEMPNSYTTTTGFVVKKEATAEFLEKACDQLGLNAKETNEFIIYWLPALEKNPYNFIHFAFEEYQTQAPLTITPQPDALIRVFMIYKALDAPIPVLPQTLPATPKRQGFTVVEWGGAEMPTIEH